MSLFDWLKMKTDKPDFFITWLIQTLITYCRTLVQ